jgi:hypothetical protein
MDVLTFHNCDKIVDITNFIREKVYFGSWLQKFVFSFSTTEHYGGGGLFNSWQQESRERENRLGLRSRLLMT